MSEMLKRIRSFNLSKKNIVLLVSGFAVLIVLLLGEYVSADSTEHTDVKNTSVYSERYIEETEKELETLLSKINGAGKVKVMVTLESCYENVYAKGYSTKSEQDEINDKNEMTEEYIIVKNGSNNEECLVVKVYEPTVKGVAIVAEGADNVNVKVAITQTVCSLFGISSAKVSVEKMMS